MKLFKQYFRHWWQFPRPLGDRSAHRSVSFLELFYDLVYVVLIAELAHSLAGHLDLKHLGQFFLLFIIVWWSWFNGMSYHDFHGNNDLRTRIFTFIQMICVAAMAAFAHGAMGDTSIHFAIAYSAFQLTLTFLWWRVGVHEPEHRPISQPYSMAFLAATLLFIVSIFVPIPYRFYLWGASVLLSLMLPLITLVRHAAHAEAREEQNMLVVTSPSSVERFGLFTIIVLGEIVVGVVSGLSDQHHLTWHAGGVAFLSILICIGLWWVYFDFVSHRIPNDTLSSVLSWTYLHIPLTASIAAVGAAVLNIAEAGEGLLPSEVKWLLVGSVAIALACIGGMIFTLQVALSNKRIFMRGGVWMIACASLVLVLSLLNLPTLGLLTMVVTVLLLPVYLGMRTWLTHHVHAETD